MHDSPAVQCCDGGQSCPNTNNFCLQTRPECCPGPVLNVASKEQTSKSKILTSSQRASPLVLSVSSGVSQRKAKQAGQIRPTALAHPEASRNLLALWEFEAETSNHSLQELNGIWISGSLKHRSNHKQVAVHGNMGLTCDCTLEGSGMGVFLLGFPHSNPKGPTH